MMLFAQRDLLPAYAFAAAGGQALHVCNSAGLVTDSAPKCFQSSKEFAHLFDQDRKRLEADARRLGVNVVVVQYPGTPRQHVDLVGEPLRRAKAAAKLAETMPWVKDPLAALPAAAVVEFKQEFQCKFFD